MDFGISNRGMHITYEQSSVNSLNILITKVSSNFHKVLSGTHISRFHHVKRVEEGGGGYTFFVDKT